MTLHFPGDEANYVMLLGRWKIQTLYTGKWFYGPDFHRGTLWEGFSRETEIWCHIICCNFQLINPSRPNLGRKEKIKLNLYFHTSFWCLKRFYEGLKDLHKTFWGTTKKCDFQKCKINSKLQSDQPCHQKLSMKNFSLKE